MRVGQNPVKSVEKIAPPAPVTVVVISYIPFLSGYYAESLEVLKLCLASIAANTAGDYDLMVFDNGSCAEAREYLQAEQRAGRIQYLLLAERNLGKASAWNMALAAAPGQIVAYADSDVYFYPGWLAAGIEALELFPMAGMVTGMPMLTPEKYSGSSLDWVRQQGLHLESGQVLPWEDFWRHARSLGDSEDEAGAFYEGNAAHRIQKGGKSYYLGAAHFQFIAPKKVLDEVLPIPAERPMGRVRLLDEAVDAQGYLRLCTAEWYVQHLGNTLPGEDDLLADAAVKLPAKQTRRKKGIGGPLRRQLVWLYDRIFKLLYGR